MANYYDLLTDRGKYPDSLELTAPDGNKVTLGAFREAFDARERELDEAATAIAAARGEVTNAFQNVMSRGDQLTAAQAALEAERTVLKASGRSSAAPDDKLARIEAELAETRRALAEVKDTQFQSVLQYTDDKWREELSGVEIPDGKTPNDVLKFAMENRILDGKLPNLRRAVEKMREPQTIAAKIAAAREEGLREGRLKAALEASSMNSRTIRPGEGSGVTTPMKSLDDLETVVEKDQEIMEMIAGVRPAPAVVGM